MGRFYERRIAEVEGDEHYLVTVTISAYDSREVEVSREVFELLEELQREHWRMERRESRHSWHIEDMREGDLPHKKHVTTPEQEMMKRLESETLRAALIGLPEIQRRRFLLHHLKQISVKSIARIEGCSDRAVKYSLALARKNLRKLLDENEY